MIRNLINGQKTANFFYGLRSLSVLPEALNYLFHWVRKDGLTCRPFVIAIELTMRCNLNCPFCYLTGREKKEDPLTIRDIEKILDGLESRKTVLYLTGGEPFLRDDLPEIIALIKKKGFHCSISTNGLLISEEKTPWLKEFSPDHFMISLNGFESEHDALASSGGAFKKVTGGIRYLVESGKAGQISVNTILSSMNIERLADFLRMVKKLGVRNVSFQHGMPTKEGSVNRLFGSIDPEMLNSAIKTVKKEARLLKMRVRFIPELKPGEVKEWYSKSYTRRCLYPYFAARVDQAGGVYPCPRIFRPFASIKEKSLSEIWRGNDYRNFRKKIRKTRLSPECLNCCKF